MRIRFYYIATIFTSLYLYNYTYICTFVSALSDPTSNSERSANGGNKQILYCIVLYCIVLNGMPLRFVPAKIRQ